jgi:hypothetical protein
MQETKIEETKYSFEEKRNLLNKRFAESIKDVDFSKSVHFKNTNYIASNINIGDEILKEIYRKTNILDFIEKKSFVLFTEQELSLYQKYATNVKSCLKYVYIASKTWHNNYISKKKYYHDFYNLIVYIDKIYYKIYDLNSYFLETCKTNKFNNTIIKELEEIKNKSNIIYTTFITIKEYIKETQIRTRTIIRHKQEIIECCNVIYNLSRKIIHHSFLLRDYNYIINQKYTNYNITYEVFNEYNNIILYFNQIVELQKQICLIYLK